MRNPLRAEPRGKTRPEQRRGEHRHRHREQPLAGFEGVEPKHGLQVHGQHEEGAEKDQLLHHERREARPQRNDPEQGAVEQRVAAGAFASLLPQRESRKEADAGEDQERDDREAERSDLLSADREGAARLYESPLTALEDSVDGEPEPDRRQ